MKQKVLRAGKSSLAVTIPANLVHALGVKPSDTVEVITSPQHAKMSIYFKGTRQLPLPQS